MRLPKRDADARGDAKRRAGDVVDLERLAQHLEQALGDELGAAGRRRAFDEHDELVAAEAGDRVGFAQTSRASRAATDRRSRSPASWPSVSLTCLKPSRSMNSAALSTPLRRARASICSTRSRRACGSAAR